METNRRLYLESKFLGLIKRKDGLAYLTLSRYIKGKKCIRKHRMIFLTSLCKSLSGQEIRGVEISTI